MARANARLSSLELEEPRSSSSRTKLMSFRLGFFLGDQSGPLHDEKLPNSYSPVVFPSVLKHLSSDTVKGCSSSSWVAAYLDSTKSLSTSEKKSNNPHIALRRKDVFPSSHRSLRSRSYRQCSFARTSSPRTLSICWLCFGSANLGACACITVSGGALRMQRKIWAAADFQNFLAQSWNTRGPRKNFFLVYAYLVERENFENRPRPKFFSARARLPRWPCMYTSIFKPTFTEHAW